MPHKGLKNILSKHPRDIVILSALRTPLTRAKKCGLKIHTLRNYYTMLYHVLRATLAQNPNLDPSKIQNVAVGKVLQGLSGNKAGRMAATLLPAMERQGKEVGVISMCMSTGMGMASLFIRE
jgi:acetyl-CoA acyltransferase 1